MKKTWSMILKVIIAVAGAIAGVIGVQAATIPPVLRFRYVRLHFFAYPHFHSFIYYYNFM